MKRIVRPAIMIVAAMLGSAAMLTALISIAGSMSIYASEPADFLPIKQTKLLIHKPTAVDIKRWGDEYPFMHTVDQSTLAALAVVTMNNAETGVIAFHHDTSMDHSVGPFGIQVSNPLVLPHLQAQQTSLGKHETYRAFKKVHAQDDSWTYLQKQSQVVADTHLLSSLLRSTASAFAFTQMSDIQVLQQRQSLLPPPGEASTSIPHVEYRLFALSMGNAHEGFVRWKTRLPSENVAIVEGLLRSTIAFLGSNVSFDYDILPLVTKPSVLQAATMSGSTTLLLSGSMDDKTTLNEILERMHESYGKTLTTTRVTKRVLDKRFTTVDLRHDDSMIETAYEPVGDWAVVSTTEVKSATGLFTATQGNMFMVAQRKDVLLSALNARDTLQPPYTADTGTLTAVFESKQGVLTDLLSINEAISFASIWRNGLSEWVLQSPENSFKLLDSLL